MARYRKKSIVVEATQWFKNGDHPEDGPADREGQVVRFWRRPDIPDYATCNRCEQAMVAHGWIDTLEGGHTVCPGDWILTVVQGERYPCKPNIFEATYEPLEVTETPNLDQWTREAMPRITPFSLGLKALDGLYRRTGTRVNSRRVKGYVSIEARRIIFEHCVSIAMPSGAWSRFKNWLRRLQQRWLNRPDTITFCGIECEVVLPHRLPGGVAIQFVYGAETAYISTADLRQIASTANLQ